LLNQTGTSPFEGTLAATGCALSGDDQHMAKPAFVGPGKETEEQVVGFALGQPMKIDAAIDGQAATSQFADDRFFDWMRLLPGRRRAGGAESYLFRRALGRGRSHRCRRLDRKPVILGQFLAGKGLDRACDPGPDDAVLMTQL
jgi:hypothetical protein